MKFTWDLRKAETNRRKHGISFEEAAAVFLDENARLIADPEHSDDEEDRFVLLGMSRRLRVLVVVHCYREMDEEIRIISARKADSTERKEYESYLS